MQVITMKPKRSPWFKPMLFVLGLLLGGSSQWILGVLPATAEAGVRTGKASAQEPVDVNRAGAEELTRLKGVGLKTAGNIISYRDEHGPFKSVEDLMNVKGIGGKKLEGIRDQIKL